MRSALGNCSHQHGEDRADDELAERLGAAAQAEAALLVDLDVVVEEADAPSPVIRNSTSTPETVGAVQGGQVRAGVPEQRGHDEHGAAHGGVPRLPWCAGRALLADLLAVAAPGERAGSPAASRASTRISPTAPAMMMSVTAWPPPSSSLGVRSSPASRGALDQHDVTRPQPPGQLGGRRGGVGHVQSVCAAARALAPGAPRRRTAPPAPGRLRSGRGPAAAPPAARRPAAPAGVGAGDDEARQAAAARQAAELLVERGAVRRPARAGRRSRRSGGGPCRACRTRRTRPASSRGWRCRRR